MDRGSVVIETNLGNIDARLNTQLDAIRAGIEETAKMRAEELAAQAESEPVEVPVDPEFEARQQAEAPPTQVEMSAEEMEAMEHTMMEEETPDA